MIYIGVDPGATGGIVILNSDGLRIKQAIALDKVDDFELYSELHIAARCPCRVLFEKVGHIPGDGGKASFSFGREVGRVEALLRVAGHEIYYIPSSIWSPAMLTFAKSEGFSDFTEDRKERNCAIAPYLFPEEGVNSLREGRLRKFGGLHTGKVDAALIALYGALNWDRVLKYKADKEKPKPKGKKPPRAMFI